jgi:hypothetical protein
VWIDAPLGDRRGPGRLEDGVVPGILFSNVLVILANPLRDTPPAGFDGLVRMDRRIPLTGRDGVVSVDRFDERDEINPLDPLPPEEFLDFDRVLAVDAVEDAQLVVFDVVLLEQLEALHHAIERRAVGTRRPESVVELVGPVAAGPM